MSFRIPAAFIGLAFLPAAWTQTIAPGGIVNAAGFQAPVAPGSIVSIFGSSLAVAAVGASSLPLPTTLGGVSVSVNGRLAPLFYVSPTQINAQLPYETTTGAATVSINGSVPATVNVAASAPGIIVYGTNRSVAVNQDGTVNAPDHPAIPGGWVTVYLSGQGRVNPGVATGAVAPADLISVPMLPVTATIGGKPADVLFAGLTPGAIGLFQVNLRIPAMASGDYPLIITVGQAASNAPMLAVSGDGSAISSVVRSLALHQITALPDKGPDYRTSFALSGNGAVIAYAHDSGPNQVWEMSFDGSGATMMDSYKPLCFCGTIVDISDDASELVWTEGRQVRLLGKGGGTLITLDPNSPAAVAGIKVSGDGKHVFYLIDRDGRQLDARSTPIQRGLYVYNVDGSGTRQIVGPSAIAAAFGEAVVNYYTPEFSDTGNSANFTLGVSKDGSRIAFAARKVGGTGPDAIFGVHLDGSGLHTILGPVRYVGDLGISADGSKVFYDATFTGFSVETGTVNFDGSGQLSLRVDGIGEKPGTMLSADGSLLLAYDILYNTDGSGALQLSAPLNPLTPGHPIMNPSASRFVYNFVVPGTYSQGLTQLATAELDPGSLGAAPAILSPTVKPPYAVAGGATLGTVSAQVSPSDRVLGVNYSIVNNGLVEDLVNGDIFLTASANGLFSSSNVQAKASSPPGPRLLRLFAQVSDSAGLRHGTIIDLTPFAVVAH